MNNTINDLNINPDLLEKNGYKKYRDSFLIKESYFGSWQKIITNEYGDAYSINFNLYDNSCYYNKQLKERGADINPYSWEADLQFNDMEEEMTVNVKVFASNKDLKSVESFCNRLFKKMEFKNYAYWEESDISNHELEHKKERIMESANHLEVNLSKNQEKVKIKKRKI